MAETFNSFKKIELELKLTGFNLSADIYTKYRLMDTLLNYYKILGRDIQCRLGDFKNNTSTWQEVSISMKPPNCTAKESFVIKESRPVQNAPKRI